MVVKATAPKRAVAVPDPVEREYRGFLVESTDDADGNEILSIKGIWLEPEGPGFRRYTPAVGKQQAKAAAAGEEEAARDRAIAAIAAMPELAAVSTAIMTATKDA